MQDRDIIARLEDLVASNPGALPLASGDKSELDTWALAKAFLTVQVRLAGQYHTLLTEVAFHYRRLYLQPYVLVMNGIRDEPTFVEYIDKAGHATRAVTAQHRKRSMKQKLPGKKTRIQELYTAAHGIYPRFSSFIDHLATTSEGKSLGSTLKSPARTFWEAGLLAESQKKGDDQWYELVTDVVSARIQYSSVAGMGHGLELLLWHSNPGKAAKAGASTHPGTQIVVIKVEDGMRRPSMTGWAATKVIFYFADDPNCHTVELEIVHVNMMQVSRVERQREKEKKKRKKNTRRDAGPWAGGLLCFVSIICSSTNVPPWMLLAPKPTNLDEGPGPHGRLGRDEQNRISDGAARSSGQGVRDGAELDPRPSWRLALTHPKAHPHIHAHGRSD